MTNDEQMKPPEKSGPGAPPGHAGAAALAEAVSTVPRGAGVGFRYFLWLGTIAAAILSSVSLLFALILYLLNSGSEAAFGSSILPAIDYTGALRLTGILAAMSVIMHILRLRMDALAGATLAIPFPDELVAVPASGDPSIDRFECSCRVSIHVRDVAIVELVLAERQAVHQALQAALVLAISDRVARYSKERIEHHLRMGLGNVLPLQDIALVTLAGLRHRAQAPDKGATGKGTGKGATGKGAGKRPGGKAPG